MDQSTLFYLAIIALYLVVFGEASTSKLREREVPQWFLDQFADTWLAKGPLKLQYRLIMVLELLVAGLFVVSLAMGEPFNGERTFLGLGLLGGSGVFTMLCFGQRVSFDFAGAASSFFYSALTLVLWFLVTMGGV